MSNLTGSRGGLTLSLDNSRALRVVITISCVVGTDDVALDCRHASDLSGLGVFSRAEDIRCMMERRRENQLRFETVPPVSSSMTRLQRVESVKKLLMKAMNLKSNNCRDESFLL